MTAQILDRAKERAVDDHLKWPAIDFYNVVGKGRQFRWLGYDTFRFDLRPLVARGFDISRLGGRFDVTDPYGRRYLAGVQSFTIPIEGKG